MFRSMYGASNERSLGSTWKRCTIHGYTDPTRMALTMSRAVPTMGRRHRPMMAVTMNRMATSAATPARIARAGMTALTSAYDAPTSNPLLLVVSVAYWSSQMLPACSSR